MLIRIPVIQVKKLTTNLLSIRNHEVFANKPTKFDEMLKLLRLDNCIRDVLAVEEICNLLDFQISRFIIDMVRCDEKANGSGACPFTEVYDGMSLVLASPENERLPAVWVDEPETKDDSRTLTAPRSPCLCSRSSTDEV